MVETGDHFLELGLMSHPVDQAQGRRRTPLPVSLAQAQATKGEAL